MSSENVPPPLPPQTVESCVGCTFRNMKCRQMNCPFYQTFLNQGPEFHRIMTVFDLDKVSEKLTSIKHSGSDDAKANLEIFTEALKFNADARHKYKLEGTAELKQIARAGYVRRIAARMDEVDKKRQQVHNAAEEVVQIELQYEELQRKLSGVEEEDDDDDELPNTCDDLNSPLHHSLKCIVSAPVPGRLVKVLVEGRTIVKKGQPMFVMMSGDRQLEVVARMDGEAVPVSVNKGITLSEGQPLFFLVEPTNKIVPTSSQMSDFMHNLDTLRDLSLQRLFVDFDAVAAAEYKPMATLDDQDVLKSFNKFDTVFDHSDHLFSQRIQPPLTHDWAENIKKEWISLQEGLPDTIFVRAYESRMDLLRAVIIGLEGTPYHNGLFFFDVCLPKGYPHKPPRVRYHSGGLIINPNLKKIGVYLKLPSTTDSKEEKEEDMWVPGTSTMLQLLVSIQKKILCANPLLCDVRAAKHTSLYAKQSALIYIENTFIKSLKTMEYIINHPPKNFEDFVVGHFRNHATDILIACKEEASKESCTTILKRYLDLCFDSLVVVFSKIGAKLPQDFLPLAS